MVSRNVEAEVALGALEAELDGVCCLDQEAGCAQFKGLSGVVRTPIKEFGGVRRPLDVLADQAGNDTEWKIIEDADAGAERQKMSRRRHCNRPLKI